MLVALMAAWLSHQLPVAMPQFSRIAAADVPPELFASNGEPCDFREVAECRRAFLENGGAWSGDLNGDGRRELLLASPLLAGSGGMPYYLFELRQQSWQPLAANGGWLTLTGSPRFDILPPVRGGYHDIRVGAVECFKWNGKGYVRYEPADVRALSPAWFASSRLDESELLSLLHGSASGGAAVNWTVYLRRAGPVGIGSSISDVRSVLGDQKASLAQIGPEPDDSACAYLQSRALPRHLGLMFQKGRLVRIDVRAPGIRTASGAAVGDSEDRIKKIYNGRIKVGPHPYLDKNGHYLTFLPVDDADREYSMVFETQDGRVTSFRTGTRDAVALKEGCS